MLGSAGRLSHWDFHFSFILFSFYPVFTCLVLSWRFFCSSSHLAGFLRRHFFPVCGKESCGEALREFEGRGGGVTKKSGRGKKGISHPARQRREVGYF